MQREELESLVLKIKEGQSELFPKLFEYLKSDLKKMASQYFIAGSDDGDIMQECRIGLALAVKDFQPTGGANFKNFAVNICCKRHLITTVSHANRKKYGIHNAADSLDAQTNDDDDSSLADFIHDPELSVLEKMAESQAFDELKSALSSKLTKLECAILDYYLLNYSYKEISDILGVKCKAVDNALMRIRKKSTEIHQHYKDKSD